MIDLEQRARRAGEAARIEAAERLRLTERRPVVGSSGVAAPARWRPLAGVAVGALALVLVVLLVGQLTDLGVPLIEPAQPPPAQVDEPVAVDGVLPVPPVGDALAAYLEDGTPVFVSHPVDGEVVVVGALNPHVVGWAGKLVVFCRTSGWFEDLYHGSRFNAWGDYTGGPAPYALPDVPSEVSGDGRTVRVTGEIDHRRPRTDLRAEQPQRGPNCTDDPDDAPTSPQIVGHAVPDDVPALDGTSLPDRAWQWGEVRLGGGPGDPRLCESDGSCPQAAPRLRSSNVGYQVPSPGSGPAVALVHQSSEGLIVAQPAWPPGGALDDRRVSITGEATPLLPLPEPGGVAPAQLYDSTPVFVTRGTDGAVHLVDATSSRSPSRLVGWCAAAGAFVDGTGGVWASDGSGIGPVEDLGRYRASVAEHGETAAVDPGGPLPDATGERAAASGSDDGACDDTDLVRHLPSERTHVATSARLPPRDPSWRWVRMAIEDVDGQLRLCAVGVRDGCGGPEPERDPTNADCYDDLGPDGVCQLDRDPVVGTPGASATDGPALLLVRTTARDGVEVRRPATTSP